MSQSDLERLRRECLRLSRHLSQEKQRNMALRQAVSATLSSVTFKAAARANRLLSRLLGIGRGATAWDQLPALLEDQSDRSQKPSALTLADTPLRHAEASCSAAGLTDLTALPESAELLLLGSLPPYALYLPYRHIQDPHAEALPDRCWAVLVVPDPDHGDNALLSSAETIARSFDCPLAVWCESDSQLPPAALPIGRQQHPEQ